jgi:hypothetical protein
MKDIGALVDETFRFMLGSVERELCVPLDWRASGGRHGPIGRAAIYAAAMARDLIRIPLHHADGIAQARFRARVRFIERTALPTVRFVLERFPVSDSQRAALGEAERELTSCTDLVSDGRFRRIDEWYATMDEFAALAEGCQRAAVALGRAVAVDGGLDRAEQDGSELGA